MRFPARTILVPIALAALCSVACDEKTPLGPGITPPRPELNSADALIQALQRQGATVERGEVMPRAGHPYFSGNGVNILLNGDRVHVFEYSTGGAAEREAALVSPAGNTIGPVQITWVDTPRFYKGGRLIVLYVGRNQAVIRPLEAVLGPPFAGGRR